MTFDVSLYWLAIPPSIRYALLVFLILLFFQRVFLYLFKKIGEYVARIAEYGVIIILFMLEKTLILLFKIFGNLLNPINQLFENVSPKTINTVRKWKRWWEKQWLHKEAVKKRYRVATYLFSALLACIIYQWPTSSISTWWQEREAAILTEQFQVQLIPTETAQEKVLLWIEGLGQTSTNVNAEYGQLTLKPDYEGGNIRESPSKAGRPITAIAPGELVYYLGEESTSENGTVWYKVQTEIGETGWISGKIVESY